MKTRRALRVIRSLILSIISLGTLLLAAPIDTGAHGANIHVGNSYFCEPAFQGSVCDRTFAVSEEVVWEGFEGTHTISECADGFAECPRPGGREFGIITPGNLVLGAFGTPTVFEYFCRYHPDQMRGRILVGVDPGSTPSSTPSGTVTPVPQSAVSPTPLAPGQTPAPLIGGPAVAGQTVSPAQPPVTAPFTGGRSDERSLPTALLIGLGLGFLAGGAVVGIATAHKRSAG